MESATNFQGLSEINNPFQKENFLGHSYSAQVQMENIRTQQRILKNLETLESTIEYSTFAVI